MQTCKVIDIPLISNVDEFQKLIQKELDDGWILFNMIEIKKNFIDAQKQDRTKSISRVIFIKDSKKKIING